MDPRLRELAPADRGIQDEGSRNLGSVAMNLSHREIAVSEGVIF